MPTERSKKPYWKLRDWRSDKTCGTGKNMISAENNKMPDLLLVGLTPDDQRVIAVECKFKSKLDNDFKLVKDWQVKNYEEKIKEYNEYSDTISDLYYVIGIGWDEKNERPESLAVFHSSDLYNYDEKTGKVIYSDKSNEELIKCHLVKINSFRPFIMYFKPDKA